MEFTSRQKYRHLWAKGEKGKAENVLNVVAYMAWKQD
jgi:hypothetical protein